METPSRTGPVLGIDVGKRPRWACLVTAEGEIVLNAPVANGERDPDELFSRAPGGVLVVVTRSAASGRSRSRGQRAEPRNRQSGTSISSVTASRQGNKRLKNLLVLSCSSLVGSDNRFGEFYRKCRDRRMSHGKAPKAVARKRLKVIYAIMRDKAPDAA